MAQPFGVGDVVGGRYRITHHVVTSADQDIIFQAVDQVLDRSVNVLLASRTNAKQVATSAKELATGERASDVQVLDLGLSAERTYLISSVVDPNQLLDLVVPDSAPYVEPYFTDSLGSELFGQSRQMQPQTYHDDAEYYARLQADLANSADTARRLPALPRRRPSFLDKVTTDHGAEPQLPQPWDPASAQREESADSEGPHELKQAMTEAGDAHGIQPSEEIQHRFTLRTDLDVVDADPHADLDEVLEAVRTAEPKQPQSDTEAPPLSTGEDDLLSAEADAPDDEEVIDDPPDEPDQTFDSRRTSQQSEDSFGPLPPPPPPQPHDASEHSGSPEQSLASFTSLIRAVPPPSSSSFPGAKPGPASAPSQGSSGSQSGPASLWWIAVAVLVVMVLAAAVTLFWFLN